MKNKILTNTLLVAALLFSTLVTRAQVTLGAKGGLNVSNLSGIEDIPGFKSKALVGFHLGGYVAFNVGRNFAVQPELLYSTQGSKIEVLGQDEDLKLNYLNIPIMAKFTTNKGVYFEAGPQFGFKVNELDEDDWGDFDDDFNNSDFSACFGLGYQPVTMPFGIGARYNIGLGKTAEFDNISQDDINVKNGVFQLSVYWRLFGGSKLRK